MSQHQLELHRIPSRLKCFYFNPKYKKHLIIGKACCVNSETNFKTNFETNSETNFDAVTAFV